MLALPLAQTFAQNEKLNKPAAAFGDWSISKELYDYVLEILPKGSTMVELGSGWASGEFSKHYTVFSIEHDKRWVGAYNTNYIYAPIVNRWYDPKAISEQLPKDYGLILVDGPAGDRNLRDTFFDNLNLFKTNVPIIFDDLQWKKEYDLMVLVAQHLHRKYRVFDCGDKKFGVVLLEKEDQ